MEIKKGTSKAEFFAFDDEADGFQKMKFIGSSVNFLCHGDQSVSIPLNPGPWYFVYF